MYVWFDLAKISSCAFLLINFFKSDEERAAEHHREGAQKGLAILLGVYLSPPGQVEREKSLSSLPLHISSRHWPCSIFVLMPEQGKIQYIHFLAAVIRSSALKLHTALFFFPFKPGLIMRESKK